jgi:hypothetical protein
MELLKEIWWALQSKILNYVSLGSQVIVFWLEPWRWSLKAHFMELAIMFGGFHYRQWKSKIIANLLGDSGFKLWKVT